MTVLNINFENIVNDEISIPGFDYTFRRFTADETVETDEKEYKNFKIQWQKVKGRETKPNTSEYPCRVLFLTVLDSDGNPVETTEGSTEINNFRLISVGKTTTTKLWGTIPWSNEPDIESMATFNSMLSKSISEIERAIDEIET